MARGISFLISREEPSFQKGHFVRLAKVGSLVLLIFYLFVSLAVFSFWLYFGQESQRVNREMTLKKEEIASLKKIESLQILLKQRLSSLKAISEETSFDYKGLLVYLAQLSSAEVVFKNVAVSQKGEIVLSGEAVNGRVLADFLDQISGEKGRDLFARVILSSISRQKGGNYSFDLNFYLKNES